MNLSEIDLSLPTIGILESRGIMTVEELLPYRKDFTKIKFVGPARADEIERGLRASEIGRPEMPEAPAEAPPREEVGAPAPPPFSAAAPGDLVIYTSEHLARRYATMAGLTPEGLAELDIRVAGSSYQERGVPYRETSEARSWHPRRTS